MNSHVDKSQENRKQTGGSTSKSKNSTPSLFQIADNRPESMQMRKIREMVNNSAQVSQLRTFQYMADNSQSVNQSVQLQKNIRDQSSKSNSLVLQRAINVEDKRGQVNAMTPQQVYKTYFNGGQNETRLLHQTGAHVDDIMDILHRYDQANKQLKSTGLVSSVHKDLLQSFFKHSYHQRRNANNAAMIPSADQLPDNTPRMKMYRTMGIQEFASIKAWLENQDQIKGRLTVGNPTVSAAVDALDAGAPANLPIKHHLGGFEQADHYSAPMNGHHKFLLEFTMTKGTPRALQDHDIIALQSEQSVNSTIGQIGAWIRNKGNGPFPASQNEGSSPGRIGLKNENTAGEALSVAVGNNTAATQAMFQQMITRIELVKVVQG